MQGNIHFERTVRKERSERPPRGNQNAERQQDKRGKSWQRDDTKRTWEAFDPFQ